MDLSIERRLRELENTLERLRKSDLLLYVEGTYTPTMTGESSAGVTTYTTQVGAYIRMDNIIHVTGRVIWTAATGTGNINISLPFTSRNTANLSTPVVIYADGITFAAGAPAGLVIPNVAYIRLFYPTTNAGATFIQVEAAGEVAWSVTYFL